MSGAVSNCALRTPCGRRNRRVSHRRKDANGAILEEAEGLVSTQPVALAGTATTTTIANHRAPSSAPAPVLAPEATPPLQGSNVVGSGVSHESWSYGRKADDGPDDWAEAFPFCGGMENSPINICRANVGEIGLLNNQGKIEASGYDNVESAQIKNNGHTIKIGFKDSIIPTLKIEGLAKLVGRSEVNNDAFKLEQVHFHWGRTGKFDEGSEHWLHSKQYPLEAHFVHYNTKYENVSKAVEGGKKDALLVVAVLFALGQDEPTAMTSIANSVLPASEKLDTYINMGDALDLTTIFDPNGDYNAYGGSLTTPTCNEVVTWVVMDKTKTITLSSLAKIKAAPIPGTNKLIADKGNFRPLQQRGSIPVYTTTQYTDECTLPERYPFEGSGPAERVPLAAASSNVIHSPNSPNPAPKLLRSLFEWW